MLLQWWAGENTKQRNLWPGLFTSRAGVRPTDYVANDIAYQIKTARGIAGASGHIHFSMAALMDNRGGISDTLAPLYAAPALVPASRWLDDAKPAAPTVKMDGPTLTWQGTAWLWLVQTRTGSEWTTQILPGATSSLTLPTPPDAVQISAVSRTGIQGLPAAVSR